MFCTRCGAQLETGDRFCPRCGAELPVEAEPEGGQLAEEQPVEELTVQEPAAVEDPAQDEPAAVESPEQDELSEEAEEPPADQDAAADDAAEEVFLGGSASVAAAGEEAAVPADVAPTEAIPAGEGAAAPVICDLPDSAFEPQTQPAAATSTAPTATAPTVAEPVAVVAPPLPEEPAATPEPKRRKKLAIAIVSAVAVVVVAAVAVGAFFFTQSDDTAAEEPTRCSLVSLVVPEDENGQPYSRYRATLKDPSGVVLSTLDVEGTEGFKVGDLTSDNGHYILEISSPDTGEVLQQTTIETDDKYGSGTVPIRTGETTGSTTGGATGGGSGSTPAPGPGSTSASQTASSGAASEQEQTTKAMNDAYLNVMEERLDTYGNGNVLWYQSEPDILSGVCLAELVDFNDDDQDELLVAYYDKAVADQKSTDAWTPEYNVEVWAFDGSSAKRAYQNKVTLSKDDAVGVDIVLPAGDDSKPLIVERTSTVGKQEVTYKAMESAEGFQTVSSVSAETDSKGKVSYQVEGKDASAAEYKEVVEKYEEGCERTVYLFDAGKQAGDADSDGEADGDSDDEVESASSSGSSASSSSSGLTGDELPAVPEPATLNVVRCADQLSSVVDTVASLRNADDDSDSSDEEKPESVDNEEAAHEAISKAAKDDPAKVFWADFDGDGTYEAFGIVGGQLDDDLTVKSEDGELTLWFVANDEAEQVGGAMKADSVELNPLQSGNVRFLKLVLHQKNGKAGETLCYSVKDGAPAQIPESDLDKQLK